MKNQFFYSYEEQIGTIEVPEVKKSICSLNLNKVIRSMQISSGEVVVILDDFHQIMEANDTVNTKTNKLIHSKKELVTRQSEIVLSITDGERFFKLTNIEE